MALLGLRLCAGFSLVAASGAFCLVAVSGLLSAVASLVSEQGFYMDCSPPGSSVHRNLQARILEWVAISFSRDRPGNGFSLIMLGTLASFVLVLLNRTAKRRSTFIPLVFCG